jgi:ETC complex I subunit-like protein
MVARIYRPARTAMQAGNAKTQHWALEYEPDSPRGTEPLMGWTSSSDMKQQIALHFETKEEAIAYAERHGIPYRMFDARPHQKGLCR